MNTQNDVRKLTIVQSGLKRPNWICRNVRQNVVLVRDRSGSMSGQKAQDASAASLDLVAELAQPANKDGFWVAVVDFASQSGVVHDITKATDLSSPLKKPPLRVVAY
jgi:Mg-chelatase subunit ChlD